MMAEDVADDDLLLQALRRRDDALGIGDRLGERLLDEDMRPRLHRLHRIVGMGVGPGIDRDHVGFDRGERVLEAGELRSRGEDRRELTPVDVALAEPGDLESVDPRVGERMAHAHVAEPDHQNAIFAAHCPTPNRARPAPRAYWLLLLPSIHVSRTMRPSSRRTRLPR